MNEAKQTIAVKNLNNLSKYNFTHIAQVQTKEVLMQGNRVLERSLERPPSTRWLLSLSLKSFSSPRFKTRPPSVLPPSFWFTNWRLYQGRRHVTYYWSAVAPHRGWVWQALDTWNPTRCRPQELLPAWSLAWSRCWLAGGQLSTAVRCGRSGGQQSVCFPSSWWRFPRALIATFALPSHADLQVGGMISLSIRSSNGVWTLVFRVFQDYSMLYIFCSWKSTKKKAMEFNCKYAVEFENWLSNV